MNHLNQPIDDAIVEVRNAQTSSRVVVVCEHASAFIPTTFGNLGLAEAALTSHAAWDPGAMGVAKEIADRLDATLVAAKTSRLVYDCNRPPDAPDAMPAKSEVIEVPGNANLSATERSERIATYYEPFHKAVAQIMSAKVNPILVTIHSFTPIYHSTPRDVEIGILHDDDPRLADAILANADTKHAVRRNEPYGASDGVTHTLKEHAVRHGHLNVMIEVRNDLITNAAAQITMADMLSAWLTKAIASAEVSEC